jgi:amino acid transporter
VNIVWAVLIVGAATAIAVAAMLAVRRGAPEGGYYSDSDRASGVFGVLATGFSVLLGFLIFLAFESYDASRSGAETEALTVAQQIQTAQRLTTGEVGADLSGQLVCYARWVIEDEWDRMESNSLGEDINPWGVAMFAALQGFEPGSAAEEANYSKWLDQSEAREIARQDRIHGAAGIIPVPLWIVLFFIAAIILVFLLGMADSAERAWVSALFMGSVVAVIAAMLLLLHFFDNPVQAGIGGLQPDAMERSVVLIDEQLTAAGIDVTIPCDETGSPT